MGPLKNLTEEPSCGSRNPTEAELEIDGSLLSVDVCACVDDLCNIFRSSGTTVKGSSFTLSTTIPIPTTHSGGQNEHALVILVVLNTSSRYPDIGSCYYAANFASVKLRYRSAPNRALRNLRYVQVGICVWSSLSTYH